MLPTQQYSFNPRSLNPSRRDDHVTVLGISRTEATVLVPLPLPQSLCRLKHVPDTEHSSFVTVAAETLRFDHVIAEYDSGKPAASFGRFKN